MTKCFIMKKKQNTLQAPVDMTQEEMDGLKRGDPKITSVIDKRIAAIMQPKTRPVRTRHRVTAAPVKITAEQMKAIKKSGKIPPALRAAIEKEKKSSSQRESTHYRYPEHAKPEVALPKK